jgi:hypothetical protein
MYELQVGTSSIEINKRKQCIKAVASKFVPPRDFPSALIKIVTLVPKLPYEKGNI